MFRKLIGACVGLAMMGMAGTALLAVLGMAAPANAVLLGDTITISEPVGSLNNFFTVDPPLPISSRATSSLMAMWN